MANARAELCKEQDRVRLLAAVAANEDESLRDATKVRDEARVALVGVLEKALSAHDEGEEQRRRLTAEAAALQKQQGERGLTLAEQVWLECLHSQVLPVLEIGTVREELEDLRRHAERPSTDELHALDKALIAALDDLSEMQNKENKAKHHKSGVEAANQATRQARSAVQCAERALHAERVRLAQVAAAHFPELFAMERLLKLGAAEGVDSDELRAVLVDRQLSHYDDRVRISAKEGARHVVYKTSYDDKDCVLKEYKLDDPSEWKLLAKEVRLLGQLSHCPYIAPVEAVFVQSEPYAAYVQLRYFAGGNMLQWLNQTALKDQQRWWPSNNKAEQQPEIWRRKALLGQLCEALRHVHSHGLAHGDVKLENVLVSLEGERATAHLADFESARRQHTMGTRGSLRASTGGGIAFTELYVAPEILQASREGRERDAKPTAMGDMFSYGVCCLFACCLPPTAEAQHQAISRFEDDKRKLSVWSHSLAKQADAHLPHLLESLLAHAKTNAEAISVRLSAKQTLLHPFHDTEAVLVAKEEVATAATRAASQQMAEAARREREAESEAQQQRRQLEEKEEALAKKMARQEEELRKYHKALEDEKKAIAARVKKVEQKEKEAAQMKDAAKADQIAAKRAAEKLRAEVAAAQKDLAAKQVVIDNSMAEVTKMQAEAEKVKAMLKAPPRPAQQIVCDAEEMAVVGNAFKILAKTPNLVVKRVVRNDNEAQYRIYQAEREWIKEQNGGDPNEVWLFNGNDSIQENMKNGFMTQYASQVFNAYGVGIYFAADPRLSMYFERKTRDQGMGVTKTILLARVTLGKMGIRASVPPEHLTRPESKLPTQGYHSNTSQENIEAIVYDNHRAFPAYLIEYESPPARDPYASPLKKQLRKICDAEGRHKQPTLQRRQMIRWDDLTQHV